LSPTLSGPVIDAVANSGYWRQNAIFTSSGDILMSGSGSRTPWYENSLTTPLAIMLDYLLLLLLLLLPPPVLLW